VQRLVITRAMSYGTSATTARLLVPERRVNAILVTT
jgi:hypothetical protein